MIKLRDILEPVERTLETYKRVCGNPELEEIYRKQLLGIVKNKTLEVIDEMIGRKKKEESKLPEMGDEYIKVERENIGYNQKRAELKKFKEEFNK